MWVRSLSGGRSVNLTAGVPDVRHAGSGDWRDRHLARRPADRVSRGGQAQHAGQRAGHLRHRRAARRDAAQDHSGGARGPVLPRRRTTRLRAARRYGGDSIGVADTSGENMRVVLQVEGGMHAHWPAGPTTGRYTDFNREARSPRTASPPRSIRIAMDGHGAEETVIATSRRGGVSVSRANGRGLVDSANPSSASISALRWKPWSSDPVRTTTGSAGYPRRGSRRTASPDGLAAADRHLAGTRDVPIYGRAQARPGSPRVRAATSIPTCRRTAMPDAQLDAGGGLQHLDDEADGSDARQVTAGSAIDESARLGAGLQVASGSVSTRGDRAALRVVSADGGPPRQ